MSRLDAVVVGAGPNGLTAAALLARAGLDVCVLEAAPTPGGGCRSAELTLPGFLHDPCAAVHAFGAVSPAFAELRLHEHGLQWRHSPVAVAHPLDAGRAAAVYRDVDATAASLGVDGARYRHTVAPLAEHWQALAHDVLRPLLAWPRSPRRLAQFGLRALPPATWLQRGWFRGEEAAALWAGAAGHAIAPLSAPLTSAFAAMLLASAHVGGWPVAEGGSQRVIDALVAALHSAGGRLECDRPVRRVDDLPDARLLLFDLSPGQVTRLGGGRIGRLTARRLRRFRHGAGVFKVDYALSAPIPWANEACRQAVTVHVGGTAREIARAEADVAAGRHPERPFVLVAQQHVADPSRVPPGQAALWAYCHVPAGSTVDRSAAIEAQIERFAPGFQDLILARHSTDTAELERYNANNVGGDIAGGANDRLQALARPYLSLHPYRVPGWDGAFLCSASTPPGGGVHGMAGYHAARAALDWLARPRAGGAVRSEP